MHVGFRFATPHTRRSGQPAAKVDDTESSPFFFLCPLRQQREREGEKKEKKKKNHKKNNSNNKNKKNETKNNR